MSTAKLVVQGQEHELPVVVGSEGEHGVDISALRSATHGVITLDPGYGNTGSCESAITFIDGEKGILRYRGYPIEQLAQIGRLHRGRLPPDLRRAAEPQDARRVPPPADAAQPAPRGHEEVLRGLPVDRAPDGDPVVDGGVALGLLPGERRPRPRPDHRAPAGQGPDDRRLLVQEDDRPAVHVPGQRPRLRRQLPAHDVRRAGRAVRRAGRARRGAEPAAHPARRPRAELLDLDRAHGRQLRGQPVRLDRRRHLRALGAAATAAPTRR